MSGTWFFIIIFIMSALFKKNMLTSAQTYSRRELKNKEQNLSISSHPHSSIVTNVPLITKKSNLSDIYSNEDKMRQKGRKHIRKIRNDMNNSKQENRIKHITPMKSGNIFKHHRQHEENDKDVIHTYEEIHEHIQEDMNDKDIDKHSTLRISKNFNHTNRYPEENISQSTKHHIEYQSPLQQDKIKVKHHHHHHHHNHVKEVIKKIPEPYPVEKIVRIPVQKVIEKVVHVPKPYPVEKVIEKIVHVPKPYPVEKIVEKKVPYPVEKVVHIPIDKIIEKIIHIPKPYPVEKIVHVPIEKVIEKIIHIPKPYPVEKVVEKKIPYPIEKIVHIPVEKIIEKFINVPKPYPIHVPKPYPVVKSIPVPVEIKVPVQVEKKVPIPFKIEVQKHVPIFLKSNDQELYKLDKKQENQHSTIDNYNNEYKDMLTFPLYKNPILKNIEHPDVFSPFKHKQSQTNENVQLISEISPNLEGTWHEGKVEGKNSPPQYIDNSNTFPIKSPDSQTQASSNLFQILQLPFEIYHLHPTTGLTYQNDEIKKT